MNEGNYWGSFNGVLEFKTPKEILSAQLQHLHEGTNGLVVGDIKVIKPDGKKTVVLLDFITPTMNNNRVRLLIARYVMEKFYPVTLFKSLTSNAVECKNETVFKSELKDYLASDRVTGVVKGLLKEAKENGINS